MDRQSSLPASLIPHLYNAPRNSPPTSTTLSSHPEDTLPPSPTIPQYPDRQLPPVIPRHSHLTNQNPFFPSTNTLPPLASLSQDNFSRSSSWREGEAGPSSLIHSGFSQDQRDPTQPARVISRYGSTSREPYRHDPGYYPSFSSNQPTLHASANSPIPPLPPLQYLIEPHTLSFDRRDAYSDSQFGSLSISGSSPPNYLRQAGSPELEQTYGSEPRSVDIASNEGDDSHSHKDKKRRAHSMDIDDNPKKSSRKTAVACNFCRGRKLRCNGAKPSCYNCTVRKFECEYVSTQRRRGPGKAPKGSRSRRGRSEHSGSNSHIMGDRLPTAVQPDFDLSPDLRPFTSVISLDTFGYRPPDTSPQYPFDRHDPTLMTRQYSPRSRTSRSRSPQDRSDVERHQSGS